MQGAFISKTVAGGNRFVINFLKECLENRIESNRKKLSPKIYKKKSTSQHYGFTISYCYNRITVQKSVNYRNKKLYKVNKDIVILNNALEIYSADVARKIKSEKLLSAQRDPDSFIDIYKIQYEKY